MRFTPSNRQAEKERVKNYKERDNVALIIKNVEKYKKLKNV